MLHVQGEVPGGVGEFFEEMKTEYVWTIVGHAYRRDGSWPIPKRLSKTQKGAKEFLARLAKDASLRGCRIEPIKEGLIVFTTRGSLQDIDYYYIDKEHLIDTF